MVDPAEMSISKKPSIWQQNVAMLKDCTGKDLMIFIIYTTYVYIHTFIYVYISYSDLYEAADSTSPHSPVTDQFVCVSLWKGHPGLMFVASCRWNFGNPAKIVNRRVAGYWLKRRRRLRQSWSWWAVYTLPETNIAMENPPFRWYLPGYMGIFMGYVSFREGKSDNLEQLTFQ